MPISTLPTITCDQPTDAGAFPSRTLADIHAALDGHGYAHLTGLSGGFDYAHALRAFGPLVPEHQGELLRDIQPQPGLDDTVSALNTGKVWPHTEWYEFPGLPPRYVALWCVQPADGPGGETTLADGYQLLAEFSPAELDQLRQPTFRFGASASLARAGVDQHARHELLADEHGVTIVRFSTLDLVVDSPLVTRWIVAGVALHTADHVAVKLGRGELLIWDNWRMLHARTAFTDRRRHLRRALLGRADAV